MNKELKCLTALLVCAFFAAWITACAAEEKAEKSSQDVMGKIGEFKSKVPNFQEIDKNKDGVIDKNELAAYTAQRPELHVADYATLDVDKDGNITVKEFDQFYAPAKGGMDKIKSLFGGESKK